jgi:hypothetical protein
MDKRKRKPRCQTREDARLVKLGKERRWHKLWLVGAVNRSDCQAYGDTVLKHDIKTEKS